MTILCWQTLEQLGGRIPSSALVLCCFSRQDRLSSRKIDTKVTNEGGHLPPPPQKIRGPLCPPQISFFFLSPSVVCGNLTTPLLLFFTESLASHLLPTIVCVRVCARVVALHTACGALEGLLRTGYVTPNPPLSHLLYVVRLGEKHSSGREIKRREKTRKFARGY